MLGVASYLRRQVKVIPQVLDALVGEVPVIVAPSKLLSDVAPGLQRLYREKIFHQMSYSRLMKRIKYLERLHDVQVGDINLGVLGQVSVLHGNKDALFEEVLIDSGAVALGHQHSITIKRQLTRHISHRKILDVLS